MSNTGRWVQEGIAKLRDAINDGETVKITHFVLSGSANLGSLPDFAVTDSMVMGTFPGQVYAGAVEYSFINDDGFLQVHAEVAADVETEFYCNGIGLIFEDVMEQKFLMAIGAVPLQQHARMVNNTFQFVLPIVNDVAGIIEVTMEPGDRVSQAQLSAALVPHEDYHNAAGGMLMHLADSAGLAHREHTKTLTQRFQTGTCTLYNKGIVSGCFVTKSSDATRNISLAEGKILKGGAINPVPLQTNGAVIPGNSTETSVDFYIYLDASNDLVCVADGTVVDGGILLFKATVPAGSTEITDPHLGGVTITDLRRMEPLYPMFMTSCPASFVGFDFTFDSTEYALDLLIEAYAGSAFGVGDLTILSRATNGFSVQHNGSVDDVVVRWTARKLTL